MRAEHRRQAAVVAEARCARRDATHNDAFNNVQVKGGQMKSTALDFYEANKNLYKTDAELKMAYDAYKKANCDA